MATLAERNYPNQRVGQQTVMQNNSRPQQPNGSQPLVNDVGYQSYNNSNSIPRSQPPPMSYNPQPQVQMHSPQWAPAPPPGQYYPQFQPFFTPGAPHVQPHPYYDPAQQQQQHFAQWAYQQMLMQQQQQQVQVQKNANDHQPPRHRGTPSPAAPQDFYQNQAYPFPHHQAQAPPPQQVASPSQNGQNYQGFHPYRRPQQSRQSSARSQQDGYSPQPPTLPYVTTNDSSSSIDSTNSGRSVGASQHQPIQPGRPRTNSSATNQSSSSLPSTDGMHTNERGSLRQNSAGKMPSPNGPARKPVPAAPALSLGSQQPSTASPSARRPSKPSPLSRESNVELADERALRRISRDDSELSYATGTLGGVSTHVARTGGLKGRLRRALTMNSVNSTRGDLRAADTSGESTSPPRTPSSSSPALPPAESTGKVRSKSLFNLRFNASTDNISLSSTVSSASVMIRKIGSMGKLARRSSIAGITRLFKNDEKKKRPDDAASDDEDEEHYSTPTSKSRRAEASVSHTTVEFEKGAFGGEELKGLSPAARLARQHTLKSKAADDARAKELAEKREREQSAQNDTNVPLAWDRGTTKRAGPSSRPTIISETGQPVLVEDDTGSDDDHHDVDTDTLRRDQFQLHRTSAPADDLSDDDSGPFDEDVTVRLGSLDLSGSSAHRASGEEVEDDASQWGVWRSRRQDTPIKGILRNARNFVQEVYLESAGNHAHTTQAPPVRVRANSYSVAEHTDGSSPGPLAHIPSPDPDHIDGLHDHHSGHSRSQSQPESTKLLDFSFEFGTSPLLEDFPSSQSAANASAAQERSLFNLPNLNSSAPVLLSSASRVPAPAPLIQNPPKRIAFAANLSIYDTFSATIYDRRCEPATCNRLTPALAQRIKEELNTFKMEEMEVHVASRVHTHFFV